MKALFLALLFSALLPGCASVFSRSAYPVYIDSIPGQTQFTITNRYGLEIKQGQTPAIVQLESGAGYFRDARYLLHFSKPGYQDMEYRIRGKIDIWYWFNFFNFIGYFTADPATGAMWRLPYKVEARLPMIPQWQPIEENNRFDSHP